MALERCSRTELSKTDHMKARLKSSREAFCRRAPSSNSGENCWIKARSTQTQFCCSQQTRQREAGKSGQTAHQWAEKAFHHRFKLGCFTSCDFRVGFFSTPIQAPGSSTARQRLSNLS